MKRILFVISYCICSMMTALEGKAQSHEARQLLLNAQKLAQFKQILTDMKKGYQVLSSGYQSIKDIAQGNFNLHQTFLDDMMQVSPAVRKYQKISIIVTNQLQLVNEYKMAYSRFRKDQNFSIQELKYLKNVYENLFKKSHQNLDHLSLILTANKLRMTDHERLTAIDKLADEMEDQLQFLRSFNQEQTILALQRAKQRKDNYTLQNIYGLTN